MGDGLSSYCYRFIAFHHLYPLIRIMIELYDLEDDTRCIITPPAIIAITAHIILSLIYGLMIVHRIHNLDSV